ncbi:MAG: M56 family metallopeptidase [Prochlorothrix sp.]|nr:M56 family metallopeptidase [Prochlorothrix sp.]
MHINLLALSLALAIGLRVLPIGSRHPKPQHLKHPATTTHPLTLWRFALPPLLLLSTCMAIVIMGRPGSMWGMPVHDWGFVCALGFLGVALRRLVQAGIQLWQTQQILLGCGPLPGTVATQAGYLLPSAGLFAGQVGWWRSRLVLSQGVLETFGPEQVAAIVAHEQAHSYYQDPFWFFWLGWLRSIAPGLPGTDRLWQELLLRREQRADAWAAQTVDPLLLAETLVAFVQRASQTALPTDPSVLAAFSDAVPLHRLEERVEALLQAPDRPVAPARSAFPLNPLTLLGWLVALLPLITIPFHHS